MCMYKTHDQHMNTNGIRIAAAIMAISALAGCGGSRSASAINYASASSIAAGLNTGGFTCTAWTPEPAAIGPTQAGNCQHNGTQVEVATFATADQMTKVLAAFASMGVGTGYVSGDTWMVTPAATSEAPAVQKILGGTVK